MPGAAGSGCRRTGLLFIFRHDPPIDSQRPRLRLAVPSLRELIRRLGERDWPFTRWRSAGIGGDWLHMTDPVGHRLEVRESSSVWLNARP